VKPDQVQPRLGYQRHQPLREFHRNQHDVRESLAKQGAFVAPGTPAQFQAQVKREIEKWREVVRISGMKPD